MSRLLVHPVTGWLVAILACLLVWWVMNVQLTNARADATHQQARAEVLESDLITLGTVVEHQNATIENLATVMRNANQAARDRALKALKQHGAGKQPAATNGPEELNRWLQDLFSAPSPYYARDAPLKL